MGGGTVSFLVEVFLVGFGAWGAAQATSAGIGVALAGIGVALAGIGWANAFREDDEPGSLVSLDLGNDHFVLARNTADITELRQ